MTASAPIHPGEHLAEMLEELGVSQYRLAKAIGVPPMRISEIVRRRRAVTADTARAGAGHERRVLAQPPADVRPRPRARRDGRERH